MDEYIFTPEKRELTGADLKLIFRRIRHDLAGNLASQKNDICLADSDDEYLRRIERERSFLLKNALYANTHITNVLFGLSDLEKEIIPIPKFDLSYLLDLIVGVSKLDILEDISSESYQDVGIFNYHHQIYIQLFNFVKNGYDSMFGLEKQVIGIYSGIDPIAGDLHYLGPNANHYSPKDPFVSVSVRDYGRGIERDFMEKMFLEGVSTKFESYGNGLGLALSHQICDLIHGFIRVESEVGKGSTFTLYFPKEHYNVDNISF